MTIACKTTFAIALLAISFFNGFSQDQCAPVGWATQNGGTTGGGSAAPVTVTNLADLITQAKATTAKVIYVSGSMGSGVSTRVTVAANKTIIGLPGATLYGGFDISTKNVIIRNMIIHGPGSVDVDGVDCITIQGSGATNIWVDHCDIYDGQDGNFDISNGANFISVTWCKFRYTSASSNHQFSNLFGSSDTRTSDRGKLKITMMYNWWTTGCKERMPRVRFGQVHMVNNLFDSKAGGYCIRAGTEADILVESNYFDAVKNPIDLYENNFTAVQEKNNVFNNTTGTKSGSGTAFTPPYSLAVTPAANVKAVVSNATCGAGANMASPTACGCGAPTTYTLTTTNAPAAGGTITRSPNAGSYNAGTVVTLTAVPASGYTFTGWSGDASGSSASVNVTMSSNKSVTANYSPITYTLTTNAAPAAGGTIARSPNAGSYNAGTVVTLTATAASGYTFTGWSGDVSGSTASVNITMNANKNATANFVPNTTTFYTLTTNASPEAGGTVSKSPNAASYASGTVVTITAIPASGYSFTGWSGSVSGTSPSVNLTMDADKTATANFILTPPVSYTLSTAAAPSAGGTIARNPNAASYSAGTVVTLTALPASGYVFTSWTGDASGTSSSVNITMNANKTVTANFQTTGGSTSTIRIEDDATPTTGLCSYDGILSSNSGASNTKVINLTNSSAKAINWNVSAPSAGSYTLNWRYVNSGSGNATTAKILVNGVVVSAALSFPKTSGSTVFANAALSVNLTGGGNTIRLETIVSSAFADIDWLEITGIGPTTGNCGGSLTANGPIVTHQQNIMAMAEISPNPFVGKALLHFFLSKEERIHIKVYDNYGGVACDITNRLFNTGLQQVPINMAGKKPGYYTVVVMGEKGLYKALKLILTR